MKHISRLLCVLLLCSFVIGLLPASKASAASLYVPKACTKEYEYQEEISVRSKSEILAAVAKAYKGHTVYISLKNDILMSSEGLNPADVAFIDITMPEGANIIFDLNGHSINFQLNELNNKDNLCYYGFRIDNTKGFSFTFTDRVGGGYVKLDSETYYDGPTTTIRGFLGKETWLCFDGGSYFLETKCQQSTDAIANPNEKPPESWPLAAGQTTLYTRAAVGVSGGYGSITDGQFCAKVKGDNDNGYNYRYLSALGLGFMGEDSPLTKLDITGGEFSSHKYSMLVTPGGVETWIKNYPKLYRFPKIRGGFYTGISGKGGGICLCTGSQTGYNNTNYDAECMERNIGDAVPIGYAVLLDGRVRTTYNMKLKDTAKKSEVLVVSASICSNYMSEPVESGTDYQEMTISVGDSIDFSQVIKPAPDWIPSGYLKNAKKISVYNIVDESLSLESRVESDKYTFTATAPGKKSIELVNDTLDKKGTSVTLHTKYYIVTIKPQNGKKISKIDASPSGFTVNGTEITSASKISAMQFKSSTTGVSAVSCSWYENGALVSLVYPDGWQNKPVKEASRYRASITFTAADGYSFSRDTVVKFGGLDAEFVSISSDNKNLTVWSPVYNTVCHHHYEDWEKNETHHWHVCQMCGLIVDKNEHVWDNGVEKSGKITYTCKTCGKTKTESTDKKRISWLYADFGTCFIGDVVPVVTEFNSSDYNKQASIVDGEVIWGYGDGGKITNKAIAGKDKIANKDKYVISFKVAAKSGYYVDDSTSVYLYINGKACKATTAVVSAGGSTYLSVKYEYIPAQSPEIVFNAPDAVNIGDDLVKLSTGCTFTCNGQTPEMLSTMVYADGELIVWNIYTGGAWMTNDIDSYLATVDSTENPLSAEQKKEYRRLLSAQSGHTYTFYSTPMLIDYYSVSEGKFKIKGAAEAVSVEKKPSAIAVTVMYQLQYNYINSANIDMTIPKAGDSAKITATTKDKSFKIESAFISDNPSKLECGKSYEAQIRLVPQGGYRFSPGTSTKVTVNGVEASVGGYGSNGEYIVIFFPFELRHNEKVTVKDPTCTDKGSRSVVCTVCGKTLGTTAIDALGHSAVKVDAVAGDCMNAGTIEHYECSICGGLFADAGCTTKLTTVLGKKDPYNHVGGAMKHDEQDHWTKCACGAIWDKGVHSFNNQDACTVCGFVRTVLPTETPTPTPEPAAEPTSEPTPTIAPTDAANVTEAPKNTDAPQATDAPKVTDAPKATDIPKPTDNPVNPEKPGKKSLTWLWILLAILAVLGGAGTAYYFLIFKKKKNK